MKIAIVGAGVSGLVAAHLLHREHEITVFEANDYAGGHTNTVRVDTAYETHHVDTGFIVFNDRNYPNFERLLDRLGVAAQPSDMSFARDATSGRLRVREHLAERPVRQARAPRRRRGSTAWSPTSCASSAQARELLGGRRRPGPSLGDWLEELPLLAARSSSG